MTHRFETDQGLIKIPFSKNSWKKIISQSTVNYKCPEKITILVHIIQTTI